MAKYEDGTDFFSGPKIVLKKMPQFNRKDPAINGYPEAEVRDKVGRSTFWNIISSRWIPQEKAIEFEIASIAQDHEFRKISKEEICQIYHWKDFTFNTVKLGALQDTLTPFPASEFSKHISEGVVKILGVPNKKFYLSKK